LTKYGT